MTWFWPQGLAVPVHAGRKGHVHAFYWQGRWHPVRALVRRWRVDTGWWRHRVWREYWLLITRTGLLAVIYQDLQTGRWYLLRVYD